MTNIVKVFEDILKQEKITFYYARKDFANVSKVGKERVLFLSPIDTLYNQSIYYTHNCLFFFGNLSKLGSNYTQRGINILPLKTWVTYEFRKLICKYPTLEIDSLRITERINYLDANLDGVVVECTLHDYEP